MTQAWVAGVIGLGLIGGATYALKETANVYNGLPTQVVQHIELYDDSIEEARTLISLGVISDTVETLTSTKFKEAQTDYEKWKPEIERRRANRDIAGIAYLLSAFGGIASIGFGLYKAMIKRD